METAAIQEPPTSARIVIIGAGIAGNSLAWHLARLGWRDIVLVDKGPLPNPGGSTGHASSFTFPVEYSRQMVQWCLDSIRQVAIVGTALAVEYFGDRYPVTVAAVGATALFDPANERLRA